MRCLPVLIFVQPLPPRQTNQNAPDLVELLIKNNADPNVKDKDNVTSCVLWALY